MILLGTAYALKLALVPGCPVEDGGFLGACLGGKVAWAYALYEDGKVDGFITSGASVHSPYIEATAAAVALVEMGVPPDRIWLDPMALHTDENAYNGMLIAEALGAELLVAADKGQASGICAYVKSWNRECEVAAIDYARVAELMKGPGLALVGVEAPLDPDFIPLEEREAARFEETGWERPSSTELYLRDGWRTLFGEPRVAYSGEGVGKVILYADVMPAPVPAPVEAPASMEPSEG